jgi:hypothetical protein
MKNLFLFSLLIILSWSVQQANAQSRAEIDSLTKNIEIDTLLLDYSFKTKDALEQSFKTQRYANKIESETKILFDNKLYPYRSFFKSFDLAKSNIVVVSIIKDLTEIQKYTSDEKVKTILVYKKL